MSILFVYKYLCIYFVVPMYVNVYVFVKTYEKVNKIVCACFFLSVYFYAYVCKYIDVACLCVNVG